LDPLDAEPLDEDDPLADPLLEDPPDDPSDEAPFEDDPFAGTLELDPDRESVR